MNNFNPWNILLNTINQYAQNYSRANASGQTAAENSANTQANTQNVQGFNFQSNLYNNQTQKTIENVTAEAQKNLQMLEQLKMDNEVVQKYVQNLMNVPNSFEKFVENALNNSQSFQFLKVFIENMLSTKELANMLSENSKEAIQKLMNIISNSLKSSSANMEQLRDVLEILTSIHTSSNDTGALRELFLLYIPINYQAIDENSFSKFAQENSEKIKNSALTILFETKSFSNLLIALNGDDTGVWVDVCAKSDFPRERFQKLFNEQIKAIAVNAFLEFSQIQPAQNSKNSQNFKIISNEFIPLNVLLASYAAIKVVFKLDNSASGET